MTQTTTDPIADMFSRIRNAIAVNKSEIELPHSKIKEAVAQLLKDNSYISHFEVSGEGVGKTLRLTINGGSAAANISHIKRLSKPGRRYYVGASSIPIIKRGRGLVIVSTSQGLMTGNEAKTKGIGGELVCEVY